MTGYGKAELQKETKKFSAEVRSLNSKGLDLSVRVPSVYRDKELELRSTYGELVVRGKSEVSIYIENNSGEKRMHLDTDLMNSYYNELSIW